MKSNCLFYALKEAIKKGKCFAIKKSKHNHNWWFCRYHFFIIPEEIVDKYGESYVPDKKTLGAYPPPLFKGHIKKGNKN